MKHLYLETMLFGNTLDDIPDVDRHTELDYTKSAQGLKNVFKYEHHDYILQGRESSWHDDSII